MSARTFKITIIKETEIRMSFMLIISKNRGPSSLVLVECDYFPTPSPPQIWFYDVISGLTSVTVDGKRISVNVGEWSKVTVISTFPKYNSYFSFSVA